MSIRSNPVFSLREFKCVTSSTIANRCVVGSSSASKVRMRRPEEPGSYPGPPSVLGNFFNELRSSVCSCFYVVCCCWLLQDCFGAPPEPPSIGVAPPQAPPIPPPPAPEPLRPPPCPLTVPIGPPEWPTSGPPGSPRGSPPGLPQPYWK